MGKDNHMRFLCFNTGVEGAYVDQEVIDSTSKTVKVIYVPTAYKIKPFRFKHQKTEDVYFEKDILRIRPLDTTKPGAEHEIMIAIKNKDGQSHFFDEISKKYFGTDKDPFETLKQQEQDILNLKTQLRSRDITIKKLKDDYDKIKAKELDDKREQVSPVTPFYKRPSPYGQQQQNNFGGQD